MSPEDSGGGRLASWNLCFSERTRVLLGTVFPLLGYRFFTSKSPVFRTPIGSLNAGVWDALGFEKINPRTALSRFKKLDPSVGYAKR